LKPSKLQPRQPASKAPAWQTVCVCVFLALAVWAVFGQTARFEFVSYDDRKNVYENPVVQKGLSVQAVGWAFTHTQIMSWIPLTTLSHMLDCQMFGLRAGGHHAVNVLLHAANAVLLFLVLRRITGSLWRSAFVAALFALHPLRAESVAWVSERKDVLSAFFFMLAIGAYVGYVEKWKASSFASRLGKSGGGGQATEDGESRKQEFFYALTLLFFALGLLAKSMVATLPFVLLLLDYWPLGRFQNLQQFLRLAREKIPLFVLAAGSCVATGLVPGLVVTDVWHRPFQERLGNALVSYVVYLGQMVFPAGLAIPYPNPPNGQPVWKVCLAFVLLAAISAGVMVCRKKRPGLLVGWLWYLGMLFPVIGIIQISQQAAHADRYTYLPGIGVGMAATWAVADWCAAWKYRRLVQGALMMAVTGALMVCGHTQTSYWKDTESLWTHTLACTSSNYVARSNLGHALMAKGDWDAAIAQFQKVLEIMPDEEEALNNIGKALFAKGDREAAIPKFQKAVDIAPDYVEARLNLGNALIAKGDREAAITQFQKAVDIAPDYVEARLSLGNALFAKGNRDEAIAQFQKALETMPDYVEARLNLGNALFAKGEPDAAIAQFRKGLEFKPDYAEVRNNLGLALWARGNRAEAIAQFQKSLAIKPGQISVQNDLAWLLATAPDASLRNGAKARALAEQASQLSRGGNPMIQRTLAAAYAEEGNYGLAATTARRALELAAQQKNDRQAAVLRKEIQLYEANTPMRDLPR
jgi:tetratricopeptide (TPR) repeat protein